MNLTIVKQQLEKEIDIVHTFFYCGVRNQTEKFKGSIVKCYPSIFIILTNDGVIKSFTYSDFIIKNIKIIS